MPGKRSCVATAAVTAAVIAILGAFAVPAAAAALKSKEEVAARIAETYGVEVLRVRDAEVDGRAAYAVTVMNPGGNFNAAFQVNTLLVDAATGAMIPIFRHQASGYRLSGAASYGGRHEGINLRRLSQDD